MEFLALEAAHRLKTQFDAVNIKLTKTCYDSQETINGTFTIHKFTPRLLSSVEYSVSLLEFYFVGTERHKKKKNEFLKEKVKFEYFKTCEHYLHYKFSIPLNVTVPTLYDGDSMVNYKLALQVNDRVQDPRLTCIYPIKIETAVFERQISADDLKELSFRFMQFDLTVFPITKTSSYITLSTALDPPPVMKSVTYKLYSDTNGSKRRIAKGEIILNKAIGEMKIPVQLKSLPTPSFKTELVEHSYFLEVALKGKARATSGKISVPVQVISIRPDDIPPPYFTG